MAAVVTDSRPVNGLHHLKLTVNLVTGCFGSSVIESKGKPSNCSEMSVLIMGVILMVHSFLLTVFLWWLHSCAVMRLTRFTLARQPFRCYRQPNLAVMHLVFQFLLQITC